MKEHPIIFTAEMVKAILEGRKTMTRRVIVPQPTIPAEYAKLNEWGRWDFYGGGMVECAFLCPYGGPGDRLWLKETWAISSFSASFAETKRLQVAYRAGVSDIGHPEGMTHDLEWRTVDYETWQKYACQKYFSWHSARFMPRFASRKTLEIVSVRAERVQDISIADAEADSGVKFNPLMDWSPEDCLSRFESLWDSLNAKRGYGWGPNPWVWPIEFKLLEKEE